MSRNYLPSTIEPKPISLRALFLNPYGSHTYSFDVGIPASDLVERLKEDTASMFTMDMLFRRKPFCGSVNADSFNLRWLKKATKNSWAPIASGKIRSTGAGCRVEITFRMEIFVVVFMFVWMSFAILGSVTFMLAPDKDKMGPLIFLPMLFPLFGLIMVWVGATLGRGDQRSILNYFQGLPDTTFVDQGRFIE